MPAPPLVREIAWLEPVDAYAALADLPAPALLGSARVDGRLGRFSYLAADPFHLLISKDGRITFDGRTFTGDPFAALQRLLRSYPLEGRPDYLRSRAERWAISATTSATTSSACPIRARTTWRSPIWRSASTTSSSPSTTRAA